MSVGWPDNLIEDTGGKFGNYVISIWGYGGFGFNSGFYKRENIKNYSHVLLSYDRDKKAIGFCFTNNEYKDSKMGKLFYIILQRKKNDGDS